FHFVLRKQGWRENVDAQPFDRTRTVLHHHQQHRSGSYRNTHQLQAVERPGQVERAIGKHSTETAWQTGRRSVNGGIPGELGIRLRDRSDVFRRRRADLELSGTVEKRDTPPSAARDSCHGYLAQARVSVAERATSRSFFVFSRMLPFAKTALPATSSSAPARTTSATVSRATPPSTSMRNERPSSSRTSARVLIFWRAPEINFCAPNPGFTDITRTW